MDLVIIGMDGLSYNMIDRYDVETDFLDNVADRGVAGDLKSVDPPVTLPAWTSFATGKDPGSHGVANMIEQAPDYETRPVQTNSDDAAIFDFFDEGVFVNLPASYGRIPAGRDSLLVSGTGAPNKQEAVPEELQTLDSYGDYTIFTDQKLKLQGDTFVDHICDIARNRGEFATEAFKTTSPDIGFVLFSATDWIGHYLNHTHDEEKRADRYNQVVETVDKCAENIADLADNVVVISDHGFQYIQSQILVNNWLQEQEYLHDDSDSHLSIKQSAFNLAVRVANRSDRMYALMRKLQNYLRRTNTVIGEELENVEPEIDYHNSLAWDLLKGCIYVNDDRFVNPQVEDSETLVSKIREGLRSLTDKKGNPIFEDVVTAGEAYADPGPGAPDLIVRPRPGYHTTTARTQGEGTVRDLWGFDHRYDGIFAACGPAFETKKSLPDMSLVDVFPTVLHALGQPISPDFDGNTMTELLTTSREVDILEKGEIPTPRMRKSLNEDRDEIVEDRLEDLGYIN